MMIDAPKPEQLPQLQRLWQEAFREEQIFLDSFFSQAFATERCRCITVEGRSVAALYWFDCTCHGAKMAYLYGVATAKSCRGQGFCRALMVDTHRHLKKKGYAGTILVPASEKLRQMYAGMGYLPGTTVAELNCTAGVQKADIRILDGREYEQQRRKLLPADGVLQEGAFTALLQNQCGLFGGRDFLVAGWIENGTLRAEELLGRLEAAPGIVRALGAKKGIFRISGNEKEFAMYCPLREDCPKPGYFGISLG